jgi:hypothetical protein
MTIAENKEIYQILVKKIENILNCILSIVGKS